MSILQVLNLFLALLLSSFGASNLSAGGGGDDDNSKLSEAFNRIGRFRRWVKNIVGRTFINVKDRILECCQRQISARRGRVKNFKSLSHFRPPSSIFLSFCLNYILFSFFSNFSQFFFFFFFFFFFSLFLFFFVQIRIHLQYKLKLLKKVNKVLMVWFIFYSFCLIWYNYLVSNLISQKM